MVEYKLLDSIGFVGYRIGNDGSVWTCWEKQHAGLRGTKSYKSMRWRQLTGRVDKDGYNTVGMRHESGRTKESKVHRLVLEAFIGPCPEGMECRHLDRNPANNAITNLKWGTHLENEEDKQVHGTSNKGERHGNHKLTEFEVWEIKVLYATGDYSQSQLAQMFNVGRGCICDIVRGTNWKHVVI